MRRTDKQITDKKRINSILDMGLVCRIALSDANEPYIVSLCYGHSKGYIYFHSAREGKKIDMIRKNPRVCFQIDTGIELIENENPCRWAMKYQSVVGYGIVQELDKPDEKRRALETIMSHYRKSEYEFEDTAVEKTSVFSISIMELSGKISPAEKSLV